MLKKSLALVLSLAMLLSAMSGLALFASAETAAFTYASFISGEPLYKNDAGNNLDNVSERGGATEMAPITGDNTDRSAHFMNFQNALLGLNVGNNTKIGPNATIEIKFWASENNIENTRMSLRFTTTSLGQLSYEQILMNGAPGMEKVTIADEIADVIVSAEVLMADDGSDVLDATGWKVLKIQTNDFAASGACMNMLTWNSNNSDDNFDEGWYVQSILIYDTDKGHPSASDLFIREDIIGYADFADEDDNGTLNVTGGTDVEDVDDYAAKKVTKADGYKLTVEALQDVAQPAVLATDTNVTLMAEVKAGADGAWKVLRADLTGNDATAFEFGEKLFADNVTADDLYVRKVVVAQTKLIKKASYNSAFINLDEPFSYYNDFQRVTETAYKITFDVEGNLKFEDASGKAAVVGTDVYSYLRVNVADDYTMNGETPVADYRLDITYLDVGTDNYQLDYNKQIPEGESDDLKYQFAPLVYATGTNSGEWKTATVYLSDAQFRNLANGADFRLHFLKPGQAIAAVTVTVGADKTELIEWVGKRVNEFDWTPESYAALQAANTAAQKVIDNRYATKAEVAEKLQAVKDAYNALEVSKDKETRYTLTNAVWLNAVKDSDGNVTAMYNGRSVGSVVKLNGWYCWLFNEASFDNFIGIAPLDENFFADSTSVTYEYDIMFDTEAMSDRGFIGFASKTYGWTSVCDNPSKEYFNGFVARGDWLASPKVGQWGKVRLVNKDFDNSKTADGSLEGAITTLGSWAEHGKLYVRNIKVYDTENPEKFIQLSFTEDVANLKVAATGATQESISGYDAYLLDSADKSLSIGTKAPIDDGVVTKGENNVVVALDYYLTACDSADEKVTLTYGEGKTAELTHDVLTLRNGWVRSSFVLDDADFGSVEDLVLNYTGTGKFYVRGVRVFAYELDENGEMVVTSEKSSTWGSALLEKDSEDHAYVDWSNADAESTSGLTYLFAEGSGARDQVEDDRNAKLFTDDKLYITVDDSIVSEKDRFVRVDITHEEGSTLYLQYNAVRPDEVTDDSQDPYLNMYRFEVSGKNKELKDVTNDAGETYKSYEWVEGGEADFRNMLGVIKPTTDDFSEIQWVTTSIYLNDAQFRGAANGYDFRIVSANGGFAAISRVEVRSITEEDYNAAKAALGDTTELKAAIAEAEEKYGSSSQAVQDAKNFLEYNYRATQEEVDAALEALANAGVMGDANGDGKVSTADAALVLQYAAELIKDDALNVATGDVNGDGKVTTADAALILQFAAELIETFPVG